MISRTGRWRTGQDENTNWQLVVKFKSYERKPVGELSQRIIWLLENAPRAMSVRDLVDHISIDSSLLDDADFKLQSKRVFKRLNTLRKKGVVGSEKSPGVTTRWHMADPDQRRAVASEGALTCLRDTLADGDWAAIRQHLPGVDRKQAAEIYARRFIEAVLGEIGAEGKPRLTPKHRQKLRAWQQLGIWSKVGDTLGRRIEATDINAILSRFD